MAPRLPLFLFLSMALLPFGYCDDPSSKCFREEPNDSDSSYDVIPYLGHASEFSLDLFREMLRVKEVENVFLSPYSIWNALALVYLGSDGDTEDELRRVLRIRSKIETLKKWRAVDYIYQMRQFQSKGYRFGLVNKAYFDVQFRLRECIHNVLNTELELIDFTQTESASSTINDFVSKMTEGQLSCVTSSSDLEDAEMVLVNVAFFKDIWKTPFKKNYTQKQRFYSFDGQQQFVDMMKGKGEFKHGVSEYLRCHVLELPYSMKDVSMFIFLPPSAEGKSGLDNLIQNMTTKVLQEVADDVYFDNIEVAIPKFSLASSFSSELKTALQNLGINDLFDHQKANLTTFIADGGVSVSKTLHQTYLKVSEEGTEAGAATTVIGTGRSARPSYLRSFICDHPFLFTIYDKFTKNILFMGVYQNGLS